MEHDTAEFIAWARHLVEWDYVMTEESEVPVAKIERAALY